MREKDREDRADSQKVLNLEGVNVRVVGGLVIVQHEVDNVAGGTDEEELEGGEVKRIEESPEQI